MSLWGKETATRSFRSKYRWKMRALASNLVAISMGYLPIEAARWTKRRSWTKCICKRTLRVILRVGIVSTSTVDTSARTPSNRNFNRTNTFKKVISPMMTIPVAPACPRSIKCRTSRRRVGESPLSTTRHRTMTRAIPSLTSKCSLIRSCKTCGIQQSLARMGYSWTRIAILRLIWVGNQYQVQLVVRLINNLINCCKIGIIIVLKIYKGIHRPRRILQR